MKLFFTILCCCSFTSILAQTLANIDSDLVKSIRKIDYWRGQGSVDTSVMWTDSLEFANDVFAKKLKLYAEKCPEMINYPFNSLIKEGLHISGSSDGQFRIYSWDTETGGTMHLFNNVFQYKTRSGCKAIIRRSTPDYHNMFTFQANGHTFYLAVYHAIGSTMDVALGIHIFTIENGKLVDAKLIKTRSGLHSDLSCEYDFGSVVNMDIEKRPTFYFRNNTIYLPLVNTNRQMTSKFILYKFNGRYFSK